MRAQYTHKGRPTGVSGPVWPLVVAFLLRLLFIVFAFCWPMALRPWPLAWAAEVLWLALIAFSVWVIRMVHGR